MTKEIYTTRNSSKNKLACRHVVYIGFLLLFSSLSLHSFADVKMKFLVMNPSETEKKAIPIKYYLPEELNPEDIINAGGLNVEYDIDKGGYYVSGETQLGPKESKTYEIEVRDIWKIPEEKLDLLRKHVEEKVKTLEGSASYSTAKNLKDSVVARIDSIVNSQSATKPIADRVEAFGDNQKVLKTIENDVIVLEGISAGDNPQENIVSLVIEVTNPFDFKKDFPIKYYLLPEMNKSDVLDANGLSLNYDNNFERVYLEGSVTLEPGTSKRYVIKVRDVWRIKETELDMVSSESQKILEQLLDTEFENLGQYLNTEIQRLINEIKLSQSGDVSLKERVANYKVNLDKFRTAKEYLDRLRSFMLRFELARAGQEGKPNEKETKMDVSTGGGKAEGVGGGIGVGMGSALGKGRGQTQQQRGGGIQGIRGLKGIVLISRSVFKGWRPEIASTWIIILAIVAFLFIFSLLFYLIWTAMAVRQKKLETLNPQEGKKKEARKK